ncbi:MAG: ANTAR domain-containing protein [Alteromonadaceae bacterium TMED7]|nr:nitrate-and nitrite-responsive positive regulator [Alteromonadaceae bacterium]MCP4863340.1 ANTAR domain-containing protein [Alteromonas sp.]RPH21661.1 MAG: ANTAR domain-containing protein [Alteromonadaceae bacterium TMED7]|tara:strand:+ start:7920 stop:9203 length:1284 start_codon:yes stop_codon:yes gene_type:complete
MSKHSDITKRFLLSAKHQEIQALQHLSSNCRTVKAVKDMIHQLQRERGLSNVFLGSKGDRFGEQRQQQITASEVCEQNLRSLLKSLYLGQHDNGQSMRLLSSITFALQGMDHLPDLRNKIAKQQLTPLESTNAYCRLITGLLDVVFEAADVASDPTMTRLLVALFNFMQGKEYAGQERAWGAIGFAESHFDSDLGDRVSALSDSQLHCFETFENFADEEEMQMWQLQQTSDTATQITRLREMIQSLASGGECSAELSEIWYDIATQRIDAMQSIEEHLTDRLTDQATLRIQQAEEELRNHELLIATLNSSPPLTDTPITMLYDNTVKGLKGAGREAKKLPEGSALSAHKSFYDLIRGQAQRIEDMADELGAARQALSEQKVIDRAKLLLMQQGNLSEQQAYRKLQSSAMEQNMRLSDLAQRVVSRVG